MILDKAFEFGVPDITDSNADTISPNVYDAGAAIKLVGGPAGEKLAVQGKLVVTADANPTARARLVGADNAGLSTNPVILADTGIIAKKDDGSTALASGDTVYFVMRPGAQRWSKRYYGVVYTLGGTNPDTVAATGKCNMMLNPQTNMPYVKAATP